MCIWLRTAALLDFWQTCPGARRRNIARRFTASAICFKLSSMDAICPRHVVRRRTAIDVREILASHCAIELRTHPRTPQNRAHVGSVTQSVSCYEVKREMASPAPRSPAPCPQEGLLPSALPRPAPSPCVLRAHVKANYKCVKRGYAGYGVLYRWARGNGWGRMTSTTYVCDVGAMHMLSASANARAAHAQMQMS
ncbi:hypothetical protein EVG20_g109 [Dentipellis fragilis]|uniref:Uncharacterized protein n=1 Tax=Dentipellis fragilis TaxID=205917 RepID=A0A4Y9ZGJ4_9AGAM|nr:hypothetical protein EVG20_g109 [Dentipellis fragilis]